MGQRTVPVEATFGTYEGDDVAFVPIQRTHAGRGPIILDRAVWPSVNNTVGSEWIMMVTPHDPKGRVVSGRVQAIDVARRFGIIQEEGNPSFLLLARFLMLADPDDRVSAINGNPVDLRLSNLVMVNNRDLQQWMAEQFRSGREPVNVG